MKFAQKSETEGNNYSIFTFGTNYVSSTTMA